MSRLSLLLLATTCMASASAAQELCGVGAADIAWAGDGPLLSDIASSGPFDLSPEIASNTSQTFAFVVSTDTQLRLEAIPAGEGDPLIRFLAENGDLLAEDDDGGNGLSSRLEVFATAGGYCLQVENIAGASMSTAVRIGRSEHEALTDSAGGGGGGGSELPAEGCPPDATPLFLSESLLEAGALREEGSAADRPFYSLELSEALPLSITLDNEDADPAMTLLDPMGEIVAENDDADGLNARLDLATPLAPGNYCLAVRALSDEALPMALSISRLDAADLLRRQIESGELSPPLDGSYPVQDLGLLETGLSVDLLAGGTVTWFSVDIDAFSFVVFDGVGVDVDLTLTVFDGLGRPVAQNDDGPSGVDPRIAERMQPGTYVIGVGVVGEANGGPARLTLERFVPAE